MIEHWRFRHFIQHISNLIQDVMWRLSCTAHQAEFNKTEKPITCLCPLRFPKSSMQIFGEVHAQIIDFCSGVKTASVNPKFSISPKSIIPKNYNNFLHPVYAIKLLLVPNAAFSLSTIT